MGRYSRSKYIPTEYKNIYEYSTCFNGQEESRTSFYRYHKVINGCKFFCHRFKTAREAALALDKKLIEHEMEPINILKRKTI